MKVEQFDPTSVTDADIAAWHATVGAAYAALWPDEPAPPLAFLSDLVRRPGRVMPFRVFVAWDDAREKILGAADTFWMDGANAHRVAVDVYVPPPCRRHGVGRALVEAVVSAARADGRTGLIAGARYDTDGVEFCRAFGARFGIDEYRSRIRLARTQLPRVDVPGFSTRRWVGRCPDDLAVSYAKLREVMNSAPQGGDVVFADEVWDLARMRRTEDDVRAKGLIEYVLCAADDTSGELVALTRVQVADTWPDVGEQHDTGVLPAYRGRGLARLVKTEMVHWLQQERPALDLVTTWNAVENVAMLAVNASLGYTDRERWAEIEVLTGD